MIKYIDALNLKQGDPIYSFLRGKIVKGTFYRALDIDGSKRHILICWSVKPGIYYNEFVGDDHEDTFLTEKEATKVMLDNMKTRLADKQKEFNKKIGEMQDNIKKVEENYLQMQ